MYLLAILCRNSRFPIWSNSHIFLHLFVEIYVFQRLSAEIRVSFAISWQNYLSFWGTLKRCSFSIDLWRNSCFFRDLLSKFAILPQLFLEIRIFSANFCANSYCFAILCQNLHFFVGFLAKFRFFPTPLWWN